MIMFNNDSRIILYLIPHPLLSGLEDQICHKSPSSLGWIEPHRQN